MKFANCSGSTLTPVVDTQAADRQASISPHTTLLREPGSYRYRVAAPSYPRPASGAVTAGLPIAMARARLQNAAGTPAHQG